MASIQKKTPARVFIDSSVLIAAAISSKGTARDLLLKGFSGELDLYISTVVLEETERNLLLKAPQAIPDFYRFRSSLVGKIVQINARQILRAAQIVERKDAPIVAGAAQARAQYLATYDRRHLLQRKDQIEASYGIDVGTPDDILTATAAKELDSE